MDTKIPCKYKLICVDTENEQTIDLYDWALVKIHYDMGQMFMLFQNIPRDVVERLSAELDEDNQELKGTEFTKVLNSAEVPAVNAWEEEEEDE